LFRRSQKTAEPEPTAPVKPNGGKGRPTPSRKEAEAAAKARAKAVYDAKGSRQAQRQQRAQAAAKMREAMRTGDERYLPARDKGPVRRFIRDYVDGRLCIGEFLLPLLIVIMALQSVSGLRAFSNGLWTATIVLVILDSAWMLWRLRSKLKARFPGEELRGSNFYAIMRVLQLRPMRQPKAKVGIGGRPKK
jgi:hypothetical protein